MKPINRAMLCVMGAGVIMAVAAESTPAAIVHRPSFTVYQSSSIVHRLSSIVDASAPLDAAIELTTRNARSEESNLADVITDVLRAAENADASFMAATSFEDMTIKKGATSPNEVMKAVTFLDDNVLVVKLNGEQIKRALEHALALYPQRSSYFLQFSGMTVTIDGKAEKDHRVELVKIGGRALETGKTYTVAMPAPLADGALAYYTIWQKSAIEKNRVNPKSVREAITTYLANKRTIGESSEPRLNVKR